MNLLILICFTTIEQCGKLMILHASGHSILSKLLIYSVLFNLSSVEVLTTVKITLYKQTGNLTVKSVCQEDHICFLSLNYFQVHFYFKKIPSLLKCLQIRHYLLVY